MAFLGRSREHPYCEIQDIWIEESFGEGREGQCRGKERTTVNGLRNVGATGKLKG